MENLLGNFVLIYMVLKTGIAFPFPNVMINGNYSRFIKEMLPLFEAQRYSTIANENSKLDKFPFKVKKFFPVGSNCMVNNFDLPKED